MDFTTRLAGLLYCARTDEARFNGLRRHGNLPFPLDGSDGKWQKFSYDDVVKLRVMLDLMGEPETEAYGQGLPPALASKVVGNGVSRVGRNPILVELGQEVWIGVLLSEGPQTEEEEAEGRNPLRMTDWFAGTLAELGLWEQGKAPRADGCKPVRLFLVNLSRAARDVGQRAIDFGLLDNKV